MPKRKSPLVRNVMLFLDLSNASARDYLLGISQWMKVHEKWNIQLVQPTDVLLNETNFAAVAPSVDGIICSELRTSAIIGRLARSQVPLVVIGEPESWIRSRSENLAFIRDDDESIGQAVACHLLESGNFAAFGFLPHSSSFYWSSRRESSFVEALRRRGYATDVFRTAGVAGSTEDLAALQSWIRGLPKPAAVMAAYDRRALHLISAARMAKVKVPDQLVVVGVDNDETICDFTDPPLTSVAINHVRVGELAADALDRLIRRGTHRPRMIEVKDFRLVQRASDKPIPPATQLIRKALSYIEANATNGITAADVVAHLKVSRRLADLRFHQHGDTITHAILTARLNRLKRQLLQNDLPIKKVTSACGFSDEFYVKRLFKQTFGVSMKEFRSLRRIRRRDSNDNRKPSG